MKTGILLLLLLVNVAVSAQSIEEHSRLVKAGKDSAALEMARSMLTIDSTRAYATFSFGYYFIRHSQYDTAIPFFQQTILLDHNETWLSGWSHAWLGNCYYITHKTDSALSELNTAISLGRTRNCVSFASQLKAKMNGDTVSKTGTLQMPNWVTVESEHITFKFQDTINWGGYLQNYVEEHEYAYRRIDSVFNAVLPRKLVYYVWNDRALAKQICHKELGFSNPRECVSNVHPNQTRGHEITHVLAYWSWGMATTMRSRFIDEGLAVAFNQVREDKFQIARLSLSGKPFKSILDIWRLENELDEEDLYAAAGAFICYCKTYSSTAQFRYLVKHPQIELVRANYGPVKFDQLVSDFNRLVGFN